MADEPRSLVVPPAVPGQSNNVGVAMPTLPGRIVGGKAITITTAGVNFTVNLDISKVEAAVDVSDPTQMWLPIWRVGDPADAIRRVPLNIVPSDAPFDGFVYGRQDGAWVDVTSAVTISWDDVVGKPATFPPTLPIAQSGITGLPAALGALAAVDADHETRIDSLETLTTAQGGDIATHETRLDGLDTLTAAQGGDIAAHETRLDGLDTEVATHETRLDGLDTTVAAKLDDAPSDGDQYARQDGAWEVVVTGVVPDGDKGDITVTGGIWTANDDKITRRTEAHTTTNPDTAPNGLSSGDTAAVTGTLTGWHFLTDIRAGGAYGVQWAMSDTVTGLRYFRSLSAGVWSDWFGEYIRIATAAAASFVDFTLPPGFSAFEIDCDGLECVISTGLLIRVGFASIGGFASGASDYTLQYMHAYGTTIGAANGSFSSIGPVSGAVNVAPTTLTGKSKILLYPGNGTQCPKLIWQGGGYTPGVGSEYIMHGSGFCSAAVERANAVRLFFGGQLFNGLFTIRGVP